MYTVHKFSEAEVKLLMKHASAFRIVITALFAALICVATMLVQIPIPATGGYANPGDGIILVCAYLMPAPLAVLAAGVGSALADILAGYAAYAPATLVIKALVALIAGFMFRFMRGKSFLALVVPGILAEIWMIAGYFFYEAVLMNMGMAAASGILGNAGQGIVGVVLSCIIAPALLKNDEMRELMNKTKK